MSLRPLRSAVAAWTPGRGIANDPLYAIAGAWRGIVGDNVAANSAPLWLVGTTLTIATRSSAWSQQLQFLQERILTGVRALPDAPPLERLAFRTGKLAPVRRASRTRTTPPSPVARGRDGNAPLPPAADAREALERLRRRMTAVSGRERRCAICGAQQDGAGDACAPCAGRLEGERGLAAQRLLFAAPWLDASSVYETLPDLVPGDYDRARKHLLARWWLILDRARRAGRPSPSGYERSIASSYVLLHSRLPPDRITPAVVRNLLGPDLERVLWPAAADAPQPPVATLPQSRTTPARTRTLGVDAQPLHGSDAAAAEPRTPGVAAAEPRTPGVAAAEPRTPVWGSRVRPSKTTGR